MYNQARGNPGRGDRHARGRGGVSGRPRGDPAIRLRQDGTVDVNETLLYVAGLPEQTRGIHATAIDTDPTGEVRIGLSPYHNSGFIGLIDGVRIYDRALTAGEVRSLAGRTTTVEKLF